MNRFFSGLWAVVSWLLSLLWQEVGLPLLRAMVGASADGLRQVGRVIAPWVIFPLVFLVGLRFAPELVEGIITLVVMFVVLRLVFTSFTQAAFGGGGGNRRRR